jgi:hypothetical protein
MRMLAVAAAGRIYGMINQIGRLRPSRLDGLQGRICWLLSPDDPPNYNAKRDPNDQ